MIAADPPDERVIYSYSERFQGEQFDFRDKSIFTRYDRCQFVKCRAGITPTFPVGRVRR